MFDELDLLRESLDLQRLLSHYTKAGEADSEAWQERLMALEGVETRELVKLHGLLIAFGWLDQNTGNTSHGQLRTVPSCYRVTSAGLRARKTVHASVEQGASDAVENGASSTAKAPEPKRREVRKEKKASSQKAPAADADVPEVSAAEQVPSLAQHI